MEVFITDFEGDSGAGVGFLLSIFPTDDLRGFLESWAGGAVTGFVVFRSDFSLLKLEVLEGRQVVLEGRSEVNTFTNNIIVYISRN